MYFENKIQITLFRKSISNLENKILFYFENTVLHFENKLLHNSGDNALPDPI